MPILDKNESWKIYRDELERQGLALLARLPAITEQAEAIAQQLPIEPRPLLYLSGSGDSYIANVSCQHNYWALAGLPAVSIEAFDIAPYHAPLLRADTPLISTSISGRTLTATASLRAARERGAPTLVITNTPGSPATRLRRPCDHPRCAVDRHLGLYPQHHELYGRHAGAALPGAGPGRAAGQHDQRADHRLSRRAGAGAGQPRRSAGQPRRAGARLRGAPGRAHALRGRRRRQLWHGALRRGQADRVRP